MPHESDAGATAMSGPRPTARSSAASGCPPLPAIATYMGSAMGPSWKHVSVTGTECRPRGGTTPDACSVVKDATTADCSSCGRIE